MSIFTRPTRQFASIILMIGLISSLFSLGMGMRHEMGVAGCVVGRGTTICWMNPIQHLSWWSSTFTGIPGSNSILQLLAILASLLVVGLALTSLNHFLSPRVRVSHVSKDPPDCNLHNYLAIFLAKGKAQPLFYA